MASLAEARCVVLASLRGCTGNAVTAGRIATALNAATALTVALDLHRFDDAAVRGVTSCASAQTFNQVAALREVLGGS